MFQTIEWTDEGVVLLDQRRLPEQETYLTLTSAGEVAAAIRDMAIRGAPAIGVAAAMGIAVAFQRCAEVPVAERPARFERDASLLAATRPTAVNLFWAIDRMRRCFERHRLEPFPRLAAALKQEALAIHAEDVDANRAMGAHGSALLPQSCRVLTHCNAGALATAGYGTALGVVRAAIEAGKKVPVYAAAPTSTIDLETATGDGIPIEQRGPAEVVQFGGRRVVPEGVGVIHPAFDVTPHRLIAAIITERGVARPPF